MIGNKFERIMLHNIDTSTVALMTDEVVNLVRDISENLSEHAIKKFFEDSDILTDDEALKECLKRGLMTYKKTDLAERVADMFIKISKKEVNKRFKGKVKNVR